MARSFKDRKCRNFPQLLRTGRTLAAGDSDCREITEAFNKEVPLRVLFDAPTIAELAQELETIIRDGRAPELPPIVPVPHDGPLPLSMNQEHLWNLHQMIPRTHFFNMPYVYQLDGELDMPALKKAVKEIFRRHSALRTVFEVVNGCPVQVVEEDVDFQLLVIDTRKVPEHEAEERIVELILVEREEPFDLRSGPLLRAKLARLADRKSLLLLTLHHIIADQWSMRIFRRELFTLYEAFSNGGGSSLPEAHLQFAELRALGNIRLWTENISMDN